MPNNNREISAEEVRLVGELLIPAVKQEMRPELHSVREDLNAVMLTNLAEGRDKFDKLDVRLKRLEGIILKALVGYGAIITLATWAFQFLKPYVLKMLKGE